MATRFRNARLVRLHDQRGLSFSSLTRGQVRLQRVTQAEGAFVKIPPAPRKSARTTRVPSHRSFNTPSDHVRRYHELDHRARRQGARRAGVRGARSREGESRKSFPRGRGSLVNPERVERARRTRGVRRRDLEPDRSSILPTPLLSQATGRVARHQLGATPPQLGKGNGVKVQMSRWKGMDEDISDDQQDIARGRGMVDSKFQGGFGLGGTQVRDASTQTAASRDRASRRAERPRRAPARRPTRMIFPRGARLPGAARHRRHSERLGARFFSRLATRLFLASPPPSPPPPGLRRPTTSTPLTR